MGRKLDLSGLSANEAEHVLQVVQRDMRLRKKEEERLSELKQALDEEGSRCLLLSRQRCFNQRCCIRCCAPFSFLLNPKRRCQDCLYSVCKACRLYDKRHKAWLCSACQKSRLLKKQSLEWFYAHVKVRFKRFGSAKVLKTIYRRHLAEHSVLSELTEGSTYEDSICNEGSVCGSDATFYRQTEEHSMAESLTVALRVAEEAIDEAICNAEFDTATQENQNEAHYLREHRAELIEELAKTIMQKIISGRKTLADTRDKCELERDPDPDLHHHGDQAGSTFKHLKGLWRSQSAFSLVDDNLPAGLVQDALQALHKEEDSAAGTTWTSVERLENSGASSMLKSPDGNWIALQSSQLSRPSLLAKRKSLVYSALERESGAVSAYEGMDSDNEARPEPDTSWGAILQEFQRKMTGSKVRRPAHNRARSDSERSKKSPLDTFNKPGAAEPKRPPSSRRTSIMDVNFNVKTEEGITRSEAAVGKVKRARKKRRSKRRATLSGPPLDFNRKDGQSGSPSDAETPDPLTPDATTPSLLRQDSDASEHQSDQVNPESSQESMSDSSLRDEANDDDDAEEVGMGSEDDDDEDERTAVDLAVDREDEEEVKARLYKLVAQSRLAYFSSTDDELDRAGRSEEDGGCDEEDKTERLSHKLCQLEEEVRAAMLSSTEDELDRVTDGEKNEEEEEEELAVKVCRLATQVGATQFSSTEDELDREEVMHEETLWRLQEDKAAPAAQVRHLASLVSASQFSSTEDELDRVCEDEAEIDQGGSGQSSLSEELSEDAVGERRESLESMGDVEVDMFALSQQNEGMRENLLDSTDQYGEVNVEESNGRMSMDILLVSDRDKRTSKETIIRQEYQPEVKMSDQREERQEEEQDILGGGEGDLLGTQLETASVSEDEDVEFDRVISSMLTMTLEEMQKDIKLDQRREGTETDEETNEELERKKDTKTDNKSKYDTKTEEERKENANTDVKTKEDFKTDGEWKEDTRTDKSRNEFPVAEQDNNKVAKTEEMKDEEKEDSKTNTNITEEPKTDNEMNQGENTDAEKEDDSKTGEEAKEHEKTDKDKDQDAKMDKERKGNSKTDKDSNKDQKADEEKKEDTKTSDVRNEDGKTKTDTQTDQERKGLEDRQDKEKIDDTRTDDGKKEDKETTMDKNKDEKYKERKKDKKEIQAGGSEVFHINININKNN
ncbi:rab effector MyRIP isoform X2 [Entelurus aequoreus]|uniref:rab effector MyRIP isoform X2 n=1 Tax=Entelurus aequoreus TaxID=161455 RepID=UPI002B1D1142|nr:rab effector MyRIP isoform X2 [Entelurus aequoreus]